MLYGNRNLARSLPSFSLSLCVSVSVSPFALVLTHRFLGVLAFALYKLSISLSSCPLLSVFVLNVQSRHQRKNARSGSCARCERASPPAALPAFIIITTMSPPSDQWLTLTTSPRHHLATSPPRSPPVRPCFAGSQEPGASMSGASGSPRS